jgi:hypothetical protein
MMTMKLKQKEDKIAINFLISKEIDEKFRTFLADKYHGYRRGALSNEFELALIQFMERESKT